MFKLKTDTQSGHKISEPQNPPKFESVPNFRRISTNLRRTISSLTSTELETPKYRVRHVRKRLDSICRSGRILERVRHSSVLGAHYFRKENLCANASRCFPFFLHVWMHGCVYECVHVNMYTCVQFFSPFPSTGRGFFLLMRTYDDRVSAKARSSDTKFEKRTEVKKRTGLHQVEK